MSEGAIEAPYTIAALPKPFDAVNGRIHTGLVHSLNGSRKRKRHEIAVGIDGESVNIYNIQNQSIASSYALPPQSYLAAPPCSIYCKRAKPLQSQRRTYWAERSSLKDHKAKLVYYTEDLGKSPTNGDEPRAPEKRDRKLEGGNVQSLHVVPTSEASSSVAPLLVAYKSGRIDCISGDLTGTRWEHKDTEQLEVECSNLTDLESIRKGLLRSREDILALFERTDADSATDSTLPILCQIVRLDDRRQVRIHALRNVGTNALQSRNAPLEEVVRYDLPGKFVTGDVHFELNAATGILDQLAKQRLTVYDLTGTLPKIMFQLGRKGHLPTDSYVRLSSASIITYYRQRLAVYDTKYGSVLASTDLSQGDSTVETKSSLRFTVAFSDLAIVVALSGYALVALQLGEGLEDARRSRAIGPLLSDVLGKGKYATEKVDITEGNERRRRRWETWVAKVDHFAEHNDVEGLEKLIAKDLHLDNDGEHEKLLTNGLTNGHSPKPLPPWALLPRHYDPQHINRKRAMYVLGKMFAWRTKATGLVLGQKHLQLSLPSRNILAWLSLAGFLTTPEVEHALPSASPDFSSQPHVMPGDIAYAIGEADPSFDLLCNLFSLPAYWELPEVVQGLKVLIDSFVEQDEDKPQHLLTNGDVSMIDGDDAEKSEVQFEAEEAAAMRDIELAHNLMEAGITQRSTAFRKCLIRLQEFNQKEVSRAIRSQMSQDEIIFLIQIMRVELANGGWTFTYDGFDDSARELDSTAQELSSDNQGIRNIAQLISCAVDAIGLSGWTVGMSGNRFVTEDLLYSLINETSAVMEGLFAAENLETTLKEVERTAANVQQQSQKRKREDDEEQPEHASEITAMPLGGRIEPPIVGKVAEARKNRALTAEQQSRSLGKYSFERIRI